MDAPRTWPLPAPDELVTDEFVLRPIEASDAAADFDAVVESRADLVGWEQTGWPADDFTVEENRADLEGLAGDHASGRRYTYTVVEPGGGRCLGCLYVVPPTAKFLALADVVALSGLDWRSVEAAVYFWVRSSLAASELESRLVAELHRWLAAEWGLTSVVYVTTSDFGRQTALLSELGMRPVFEVREPRKAVPYLAFAPDADTARGRRPGTPQSGRSAGSY